MVTVERVTRKGLPLTPAMRRLAQRSTLWRTIVFVLALLSAPLYFVWMLADGLSPLDSSRVLVTVVLVLVWAMLTISFGRDAAVAYRIARDGTYTRYVGPFTLSVVAQRGGGGISRWLVLNSLRVKLVGPRVPWSEDFKTLSVLGSGVVDWLPGFGVLVVWDDGGSAVYRTYGYGADPDLAPPPPAARTRAWPEG